MSSFEQMVKHWPELYDADTYRDVVDAWRELTVTGSGLLLRGCQELVAQASRDRICRLIAMLQTGGLAKIAWSLKEAFTNEADCRSQDAERLAASACRLVAAAGIASLRCLS